MSGIGSFLNVGGGDAELNKALLKFFEKVNLEFKTDLSYSQILAISQMAYDNEYWKTSDLKIDQGLDKIAVYFMMVVVSHDRKGRLEGMEVLKHQIEKMYNDTVGNRLLGRS